MKRLMRPGAAADSLFLAGVKIITMLTGILSTMILSHRLSLLAYGTYSQGNVVISVGASLSILGLADAVNFFYNGRREEERRACVNTVLLIELAAGLAAGLAIIALRRVICDYFGNPQLMTIFALIAFRPLLDNLINTLQVLQVSIGRARVLAVRNLILSLTRIVLVSLTAYLTQDIRTLFLGYLLLEALTALYFWATFTVSGRRADPARPDWRLIPAILSYSLPMAAYSLTKSLLKDTDKLVIGWLAGTEGVAIYANCAYALPFDAISGAFLVVLVPILTRYVARGEEEQARRVFSEYLRIGYMTTCVFASAVLLVAPEMIAFLFGEKYLSGTMVFRWYLVVDMLKFANLSIVLSVKGWTKRLMAISAASLALNGGLNVLLYDLMGFDGPAVASVLVSFLTTAALCMQSAKALQTSFARLVDWKEVARLAVKMAAAALPCLALRNGLRAVSCPRTAMIGAVGVVYVGCLFFWNRKELMEALRDINRHRNVPDENPVGQTSGQSGSGAEEKG